MKDPLEEALQRTIDYQGGSYTLNVSDMWKVVSALSAKTSFDKHKKKTKRIIKALLKTISHGSPQEERSLKEILAAEKFIKEEC